MKSFLTEFQTFAVKGNVIDLAVAVVIGTAFGKIVSSLVDNLITPLIGLFLGGVNVTGLSYAYGNAVFGYGAFVQSIIDFLIVALVIFLLIKAINHSKEAFSHGEAAAPETPAEPPEDIKLLREIRDSLRR